MSVRALRSLELTHWIGWMCVCVWAWFGRVFGRVCACLCVHVRSLVSLRDRDMAAIVKVDFLGTREEFAVTASTTALELVRGALADLCASIDVCRVFYLLVARVGTASRSLFSFVARACRSWPWSACASAWST